jgi:PAS domain S-box-containing protein
MDSVPGAGNANGAFREMVEALPVAIYATDAQGRLTWFNAAAATLSGRAPEIGTDQWCVAWKIFLPDGTPLPHDQCPMALALKGGRVPGGIECIAERPDGTRFWFTPYPAVLRDAEGRITGGINLLVDITDSKAAELEANERFRAVVETTPECVKIVASDGTLLQMNSVGLAMVGASSAGSVTGRSIYDLIAPEDRHSFREFNERICQGEKGSLEFDIIGLTGVRRHMETHAAPLRNSDGAIAQLAVTRDISESRRAERAALLLGAIVDSSDDAIVSKDLNGIITSWNKSAERVFGYTAAEAIGQSITLLIPPDRLAEETEILNHLRRGERVDRFETVRQRKDGALLDISLTVSPVKDAKGRVIGASKVARDITQSKQADRAALLLSAIVDSSDDAIISKDLNGIITTWNIGAQRVFGYTAAEVIGKPVTILIPSDRLDEEPEILSRLKRGERVDHFETIRKRKDGSLLDISLTISPVKDKLGNIIGVSKIARDITERKRAQAALLASEARFRQLADAMPQIVWTARADGYTDYYNERWYEFTGFARQKSGDLSWAPILHPDDIQRCRETWYGCVRSGEPYNIEYRFWDRHDRRWRWFIGRALPVRDADGTIVKWFGSCTDIDDLKRVEDDLRRANQDLEQFAFSASHDLQEPLRSVKIYSELLTVTCGERLDGDALQFLEYVRGGATRMEMLVRDLLTYTQVPKFEKPPEPTGAGEALTSVLASLAGAISEAGARVVAEPLPSVRVHAAHLQQLLQNLIGNAIKYRSPDRPPVVHVTAERQNEQWIFAVSDNGIGIPSDYKERIFGLFKRLHTSDEYSGTGIGLAICKRIVDRYQGRIWVESEPGRGSTFRFAVPV